MGPTTQSLAVIALACILGGSISGWLSSGCPASISAVPEVPITSRDLAKAVEQLQATIRERCVQQEVSCPQPPDPDDWGLRPFLQGLLT